MTLSELVGNLENRFPVALEMEDWYGVPVFIQREPIYIALCEPVKDSQVFRMWIKKEEYGFPYLFDSEKLTASDVINQVGKYTRKPEPRVRKERNEGQLSLFDMI